MHDYTVVDAFARRPLPANPVAVFFGGDGLSPETRQRIAGEMNLSEVTFGVMAEPVRVRRLTDQEGQTGGGLRTLRCQGRWSSGNGTPRRLSARTHGVFTRASRLDRDHAAALLRPAAVEFWSVGAGRLRRRLGYDREGQGWTVRRLRP
ncbi:pyridoxine 5'-phosphate oxidase C-terminal domain-containing protein [Streptomyces sp. NPDC007205]|uniref:pyridoxine 5'-phosphate oxidase C-terminal domain-containing protein n=1 Tax=Streptomyces sp. NPDC007205 TaxID=3154316 RepID=UPI0033C40202